MKNRNIYAGFEQKRWNSPANIKSNSSPCIKMFQKIKISTNLKLQSAVLLQIVRVFFLICMRINYENREVFCSVDNYTVSSRNYRQHAIETIGTVIVFCIFVPRKSLIRDLYADRINIIGEPKVERASRPAVSRTVAAIGRASSSSPSASVDPRPAGRTRDSVY